MPTRVTVAVNVILLGIFTTFIILHVSQVIKHQPEIEASHFPSRAVDFLAQHHLPGPIFNHYDWGGYLIWRLHPEYPVFVDGRADLYGDQLMTDFANAKKKKKKRCRNSL